MKKKSIKPGPKSVSQRKQNLKILRRNPKIQKTAKMRNMLKNQIFTDELLTKTMKKVMKKQKWNSFQLGDDPDSDAAFRLRRFYKKLIKEEAEIRMAKEKKQSGKI